MDQTTAEVVLTQPFEEGELPIKFLSCSLTPTEAKAPSELEKAVSIIHWGVKKASKYIAYHSLPKIAMLRSPE